MTPAALSARQIVRTTLIVGAVVFVAWLAWQLADVILLGFAAVLLALVIRSVAMPFERWTPVRPPWSLLLAIVLLIGLIVGFVVLLGAQIQSQISALADQLPQALASFGNRIGIEDLPRQVVEQAENVAQRSAFAERIVGYTSGLFSALASALLVLVAGIYLAAGMRRYRDGMLMLLPKRVQPEGGEALDNLGSALRLWLLGQFISMVLVGTLTTVGLYALGMPSALALGLLAGVSEFVPYVGPVVSAVPAVLIALSEGGTQVFWVLGLYILVQQIESNIIMPIVQRKVVDLPPVLTLFAILGFGVLFGPLGVVLGTPLAVVVYVLVKQLYIKDALNQETSIPGEDA